MTEARFQVDSRITSLLGESYRSTEQALKELVDNAWDADAANIWISLPDPISLDPIIVRDDGIGMTEEEVRSEYLFIANGRLSRKGERSQKKNRLVKGRKGIGKFAGLVAANVMKVETRACGCATTIDLLRAELLASRKSIEKFKLPINSRECSKEEHGTTITLSDLNQSLQFPVPDTLRSLLVLEYGRADDIRIVVNDVPLDLQDVEGQRFEHALAIPGAKRATLRLILADSSRGLKEPGIAIRVDGKVVGRPLFFGLDKDETIPNRIAKRLYGEVEVEGLGDMVTADWGGFIENSKVFQVLGRKVAENVKGHVESAFKKEVGQTRARIENQLKERLDALPELRREAARIALERVMRKFFGESTERIAVIASIVLDAFERDEYWSIVEKIQAARTRDVQSFADALDTFGLYDIALVATQARRRLEFLDGFDALIAKPDTLEQQVHKALENNLWVFGSGFETLFSNKTLKREIEEYTQDKFSGARAKMRPDLFLAQRHSQRHLLIEFKRPSLSLGRDEENQAEKYRDDLNPVFAKIQILVLGGRRQPSLAAQYERSDVKLMSYAELISNARTTLDWLVKELATEPANQNSP